MHAQTSAIPFLRVNLLLVFFILNSSDDNLRVFNQPNVEAVNFYSRTDQIDSKLCEKYYMEKFNTLIWKRGKSFIVFNVQKNFFISFLPINNCTVVSRTYIPHLNRTFSG